MSTHYYLINKEESKRKNKILKKISSVTAKVEKDMKNFLEKNEIDVDWEYDLRDAVRRIETILSDSIREPEEIKICISHFESVTFLSRKEYRTLEELKKYCKENSGGYRIEDEYGNNFTWDQFVEKLDLKNSEVKWRYANSYE